MARSATADVDVVIVGAGVVGCSIAMALSRHALDVLVLERRDDVGEEASKANTGIADSGWDCTPGTLEAELVTRSSPRWEELTARLDVPFRRCGAVSLALNDSDVARVDDIVAAARANGVRARRLDGLEVRAAAPWAAAGVAAAVEVPEEGIVDPVRLTLAYAEVAARNGVRFAFEEPLTAASAASGGARELRTPSMRVRTRFVVNAAGLGAGRVARILGAEDFDVWPRRGEYLLVDREFGRRVQRITTQLPNAFTRGVMVVPATHGSLLLGPTAHDDRDPDDRSTHPDVLARIMRECRALVPELSERHVVKNYAGLRPASDPTYRVERSERAPDVVHACGIRSTGVSSSPAIGEYVRDLLADAGLSLVPRRRAVESLPARPRLGDALDADRMARDPLGRTVVCACEKVTALEVHDALRGPLPARSVVGVAKRTRATWGRCQGAACLSGVCLIASCYLDGPAWRLPMAGSEATLGVGEARVA
jgi:glycerol-3-phosphate dehydrogenase